MARVLRLGTDLAQGLQFADFFLQAANMYAPFIVLIITRLMGDGTALWKYGIPLDSSNSSSISRSGKFFTVSIENATKLILDWMMFAASSTSDTTTRNAMISQVWEYASVNSDQNLPFPVLYDPDNGMRTSGVGRYGFLFSFTFMVC